MEIIDRIVRQRHPPENKHVLWIDSSKECNIANIYINGNWVPLGCGCNNPHPDDPVPCGAFSNDFNMAFDI